MHHLLGRALAASVALSALLAGPAAAQAGDSPPGQAPLTFSPAVASPSFAGLAVPATSTDATVATIGGLHLPDGPSTPEIDGYGTQDEEFHCDPTAKPGTVELAEMVGAALETEWGIERACGAGGYGKSRHKMGLAIDVMLDSGTEDGRANADALIGWLLEPDAAGNPNARARRLGVTQIIWSDRIWQAAREADHGLNSDISTWSEYHHPIGCASDTCRHRDHVHLSMSVAGGEKETTWWTYEPAAALG